MRAQAAHPLEVRLRSDYTATIYDKYPLSHVTAELLLAVSPFVIKALVDTITGGDDNDTTEPIGIYRSGPKIEQFFLDCGIDMRIGQGGRLGATTDALRRAASQWNGDDL